MLFCASSMTCVSTNEACVEKLHSDSIQDVLHSVHIIFDGENVFDDKLSKRREAGLKKFNKTRGEKIQIESCSLAPVSGRVHRGKNAGCILSRTHWTSLVIISAGQKLP